MRFRLVVTGVAVFAAVTLTTVPVALAPQNNGQANASTDNALVVQQMAAMPLAFTENRGQWDEWVRFRASAGGTTLWFGRDGITYQFTHRVPRSKTTDTEPLAAGVAPRPPFDRAGRFMPSEAEADSIETVVIHAAFAGSNPEVELAGENRLEYRCNYFLGNDPGKWRTDVPNYTAVVYRDVYPGVDVRYEGKGGALTCSYSAASESDLAQVKFQYEGFDSAHPEGNAAVTETGPGQFRVEAPWGAVLEPLSSGQAGGLPRNALPVAASTLEANGATSVSLVYSTYLGGSSSDNGEGGIAVDLAGSAYVTGTTASSNFPTQNPFDGTFNGVYDVFVTKLSPAGNTLVYSTYLGGSADDQGSGIAVDQAGSAYVTGTASPDFPTQNPYDGSFNGGVDGFVTKLSPAGNALVYSTFLGGSSSDYGYGIVVDQAGSAYVTGYTWSANFPTQNPYDGIFNGPTDLFVTKLSPTGNALVYSTYLGGSGLNGLDRGYGISVDSAGSAYVTGMTLSSDFPTQNPYDGSYNGNYDAFVTKLSPAGNALVYSTFLGGSSSDYGYGIAVDTTGSAYVTGYTYSPDFPTQNPYDGSLNGSSDVFVTKLSPTGNALVYSTYLGGSDDDYGYGIAVDLTDSAYVTGWTYSTDFPTQNSYDPSYNGTVDAFVTKLSYAPSSEWTLSVASSPASGVSITMSPSNCPGGTTTPFPCTYTDGTPVNVTAPAMAGGNNFSEWQRNGSFFSSSTSVQVTMDADYSMTAVFVPPGPWGANSVVIVSDTVSPSQVCSVYVKFTNDVVVEQIVCPLTVREVTTGCFPDSVRMKRGDRLVSTLAEINLLQVQVDSVGTCKAGQSGGYVGTPRHNFLDAPDSLVALTAPDDGLYFGAGKLFSGALAAGADVTGSLVIILRTSATEGTFEIDTTCTNRGNHLMFAISTLPAVFVVPDFAKGVITVTGAPPPMTVTNLDDSGPNSLRRAIDSANASPGPDTITFAVAGTIPLSSPLSALSDLTGSTLIDGLSAPGASPGSPTVILDGSLLSSGSGIDITSPGNVVRGLEIRKFPGSGIVVRTGAACFNTLSDNRIYGNGGLGIDVNDDGITPNDPGDSDTGPNDLVNYPVFDSVVQTGADTFAVFGTAAPKSRVELFLAAERGNPLLQPEGTTHGPAYRLLGWTTATVSGFFSFDSIAKPEWSQLTATTTDTLGNTSELALNKSLTPDPLRITAYSEPVPPVRGVLSMPMTSPSIQVVVISPLNSLGKRDTIGPPPTWPNTFGSRASYDSLTDYNSGGRPDSRVKIVSSDTGEYQIKYVLIGDPGSYLTGIGIDGHAEVKKQIAFAAMGQIDSSTHRLAPPLRGDLNGDGVIDVFDVIASIDMIFSGAPMPDPPALLDVNCDGVPDVFDVIYLIDYAFSGGPAPCQ